MDQYDDATICAGIDCTYSLWDEQQRRYEMTLQQAYTMLVASLETGVPLAALNPEKRAYADVQVKEVEIPADSMHYLAEHPDVKYNPANPLVQEMFRVRMNMKKAAEGLTDEQKQERDWLHW